MIHYVSTGTGLLTNTKVAAQQNSSVLLQPLYMYNRASHRMSVSAAEAKFTSLGHSDIMFSQIFQVQLHETQRRQ